MNIYHERTVDLEVGFENLEWRVDLWAEQTAFHRDSAAADRWTYRRGHWLHTIYSFNIRKWPTTAIVERVGSQRVRCSIQCKCWWTVPLLDDSEKLLDDLEQLVARICERHVPGQPADYNIARPQ
jgi:hypothetical protein